MEIVSFEGGLNTKVHPQFVQPNQATILNNVDVFDGTLKSSLGHIKSDKTVGSNFYKFREHYVSRGVETSFVEYDQKLFLATATETSYTEDGVNFKTLGNNPPDSNAKLVLSELVWVGNPSVVEGTVLPSSAFEYRIVQDGYTYIADYDTSNSDFDKVIVSFTIPSFAGVTELYRKVDDIYRLVASEDTTSGAVLTDGTVLEVSFGDNVVLGDVPFPNFVSSGVDIDGTSYALDKQGKLLVVKPDGAISTLAGPTAIYNAPPHEERWELYSDTTSRNLTSIDNVLHSYNVTISLYRRKIWNWLGTNYHYEYSRTYGAKSLQLDGNVWVSKFTRTLSGFDDVSFGITDLGTYLFDMRSGNYYLYTTAGLAFEGQIPTLASVTNPVTQFAFSKADMNFFYVLKRNGDVHKYPLGSRSTVDSLIKNIGTPYNSGYIYVDDKLISYAKTSSRGELIVLSSSQGVYTLNPVTGIDNMYPIKGLPKLDANTVTIVSPEALTFVTSEGSTATVSRTKVADVILGSLTVNTLNEVYNYLYTFSDVNGANETTISESESITVDTANIRVNFATIDSSTQAELRVYRNGGVNIADSKYRLVTVITLPITGDYLDNLPYGAGDTPPVSIDNEARQDLQYLTYHRGRLWGAGSDLKDFKSFTPTAADEYPVNAGMTGRGMWQLGADYTWVAGDLMGMKGKKDSWIMYDTVVWTYHPLKPSQDGDKLYFSDLGEPTQWADIDYILIPKDITAIGSTPNGLVITSHDTTYVLLGSTLNEFSLVVISDKDGCISNASMQAYKGNLLYVSSNGLQQTNGGAVQNISRPLVTGIGNYKPAFSAVVDDVYYVDLGGEILAFDFRVNMLFSTFDRTDISGMANIDGKLELVVGGKLSTAFVGTPSRINYKSGLITLGAINMLKEFNSVWVRYTGILTLTIYIDGMVVGTHELVSTVPTTYKYIIGKTVAKGYGIQFEVTGIGQILAIEFKNGLREN